MKALKLSHIMMLLLLVPVTLLVGCGGSDGSNGATGAAGKSAYEIAVDNGFTGTEQEWLLDQLGVGPEQCVFCHNGSVARNGVSHQEIYDELFQQDVILVTNVAYSNDLTNDTVTFNMTKSGIDFDCTQADSLNIRFTEYTDTDPANRFAGVNKDLKGTVTYLGGGTCQSVKAQAGDLSTLNGLLVVYGEDEILETLAAAHINLGKYPFSGYQVLGTVDYQSAANTTGCENCHQTPYYKHGYIRGDISGGSGADFYACKLCHVDNVNGSHPEWKLSANDPQRWAEIVEAIAAAKAAGDTAHDSFSENMTAAEKTEYAYKRRLMNDVHMSHSMEFPYPQPIRTCATCHSGKLTQTLSDENFTLDTCLSCHPVTGGTDTADAKGNFAVDTTRMSLKYLWANSSVGDVSGWHLQANGDVTATPCNTCHNDDPVLGIGSLFSEIHTGYEPRIYYKDAGGNYQHYRDAIVASIDSVTVTGSVIDIKFSASGTAGTLSYTGIVPTVQVSFYGYDSKDFILSNHTRNSDGVRMEKTMGTANALFTEVTNDPASGSWEVTLDMAAFATGPDDLDILANIASGIIKKAEVIVRPRLNDANGDSIGLNAVSKTIDVTTDATDPFVADYYQGASALVKVDTGCNRCHDQLAVTFHSGDRGGSIVVCRSCHVVTEAGSHLAGQSRSIDSYVHAVHRFQAFDVDNIDFSDPVEKAKYEEHIEFLFPDFAAVNCERCHTDHRAVDNLSRGTFDIPDQSKSMPGLLSVTDELPGFNINATPEVVVGPAARACGGCHRAQFIKEDDTAGYILFNEHTKRFGYRVENDSNDNMLYSIISYIMGLFQ